MTGYYELTLSNMLRFLFILSILYCLFKYFITLYWYSQSIPSKIWTIKHQLAALCGVFPEFAVKQCNGYSAMTFCLQYISGMHQIFKGKELFIIWASTVPVFLLVKPEAVEQVVTNDKIFNKKGWFYKFLHCWLGTGLLTSHGQKWKSRRKLLTPAFHFDILKDFLPIINEKSLHLVKKLGGETSADHVDIVNPITLCSLDIICETTLGVDINAQEKSESEYIKAVARGTDSMAQRSVNMLYWFDFTYFLTSGTHLKKDLQLLHSFTLSVIHNKKKEMLNQISRDSSKNKRKPLIEVLLEHHIQQKDLTLQDIREEVDTFTFEGHDTTSMAMIFTLYLIGLHPEVQHRVYEELREIFGDDRERPIVNEDLSCMKYLECVIKESLRLYPPVPFFSRTASEDTTICGYPIKKGMQLFICPYLIHRDEDIYPNAEIFDPGRFEPENCINRHLFAYIPFAAGPRNCIGQRFAMMEVKVVVANILRNFTLQSLDPRDKLVTSEELILRPAVPVRIRFRKREKSSNF